MTEPDSHLRTTDHAGVRTVMIDRPEAKNAMNGAMRRDLCAIFAAADQDPDVHVVVLTGRDPVFTAGVDFKDVSQSHDPYGAQFQLNPGRALRAMRTPVIAAVNGACVSGGLELALSCSFVVASDRARFADTHARLGVVPTWGLTALLPRAVGIRKATEMSITGNFVGAAEALTLGLVNHVVPHDELAAFAQQLAEQVATTAAVGEILALYRQGEDLGREAALGLETAHSALPRTFDPAAFAAAGRAAAERQRTDPPT